MPSRARSASILDLTLSPPLSPSPPWGEDFLVNSGHKVPSSLIVRSSPSAEEDVPAKVEVTLSKTEHMRLDAKDAANSKWDKRRLAVEIVKDVSIAAVSALIAKFL
jgi:hypothetical protein